MSKKMWRPKPILENHVTTEAAYNLANDLRSQIETKERELKYYKQLAEAGDNLLKVMERPINNAAAKDNSHFELFMKRHNVYQLLKSQKPNSEQQINTP